MRIAILVVALLLGSLDVAVAVTGDKETHFATSAGYGLVIGTAVYKFADSAGPGKRIAISSSIALIPGFVLELLDNFEPGNRFGWGDLLADGVGAVTGAVAAELINGQLWLSASGRQIRLIGHW